ERLMTTRSRNCTRSKVVKRPPHIGHTRRRRMTAPSSAGRESFTCVSSDWQYGQRIAHPRRILFVVGLPQIWVKREARAKRLHLRTHSLLDGGVALVRVRSLETVQDLGNQLADLSEFGSTKTAGRSSWGSKTNT